MLTMPSGWREVVVGDIASSERNALVGGPFGSNLVSLDYVERGVPVIRGQNMGERWVGGEFVYVSAAKAESLAANLARPGDIVFTQRGTLGQVSLVPHGPHKSYLVSQSQMKLTVDREVADPIFLYYVFRSDEQQAYIRQRAIQGGVPHTNLGILRTTPVPLPSLPVQHSIARILGALDDKIELNRKMNETLEQMARAIFKSWFVDFEPFRDKGMVDSPLGRIPKGWKALPLDEVAVFLNGLALQKFPPRGDRDLPVIKIAQLHSGNTSGADQANADIPDEYVINNGDVLFSWSGSLSVVLWCGGKGALNQHLFKVTSTTYSKWFYLHWVLHHLPRFQEIASDKATTMGHIQRHHLTESLVVVPDTRTLKSMDAVMSPLVEKQVSCRLESRTLAAIRDALLPKLMSGEVRAEN
jgi:type I restriction enzyme, S subunit